MVDTEAKHRCSNVCCNEQRCSGMLPQVQGLTAGSDSGCALSICMLPAQPGRRNTNNCLLSLVPLINVSVFPLALHANVSSSGVFRRVHSCRHAAFEGIRCRTVC